MKLEPEDKFLIATLSVVVCVVGLCYYWMISTCMERAEMEGFSISKTVATKCYASNDGKKWEYVWR